MFPLQSCERRLNAVVLVEFGFDVVLNIVQLLLKIIDQLPKWTIDSVSDFVPLEVAQVVVYGFWKQLCQSGGHGFRQGNSSIGEHTVIDRFLVRKLFLVAM